jgi:hypothetical protein
MYMNVLVVDERVRDYQVFVDSVNSNTQAIVFRSTLELPFCDRIGFVFELGTRMAEVLLQSRDQLIASGIKHMDFLACDSLPEWNDFYTSLTGITVGASNNRTGNIQYGGDWLMESTCEDIEKVYFARSIEYYKYLLSNSFGVMTVDIYGYIWSAKDLTTDNLGLQPADQMGFGDDLYRDKLTRLDYLKNVTKICSAYSNSFALSNGSCYSCGKNNIGRTGVTNKFLDIGLSGVTDFASGENCGFVLAGGLIYRLTDTSHELLKINNQNVSAIQIGNYARYYGSDPVNTRYYGQLYGSNLVYLQSSGILYNMYGESITPPNTKIVGFSRGRDNLVLAISDTRELYRSYNSDLRVMNTVLNKIPNMSNVTMVSAGATTNSYSRDMVLVGKQLYTTPAQNASTFQKINGFEEVEQVTNGEFMRFVIMNKILYLAGNPEHIKLSTTGKIGDYTPMLKSDGTIMNLAYLVTNNINVFPPPKINTVVLNNKILTIVGENFSTDTTFTLDNTSYIPPSSTTQVTTINFDNYSLKNNDMVKSFVVKYDGVFPASSGTVTFKGLFKATSVGTWQFKISADDSCVIKIGTNGSILNRTVHYDGSWDSVGSGITYIPSITVTDLTATYPFELLWTCGESNATFPNSVNVNKIQLSIILPDNSVQNDLTDYFTNDGEKGFGYTTTESVTRDLITPYNTLLKLFYYGNSVNIANAPNNTSITRLNYAYQKDTVVTLFGSGLSGLVPTGLTTLVDSDFAPTFNGYTSGTLSVKEGLYSTDSVNVMTINKANASALLSDIVTIRNSPEGKIPDTFGTTTLFPNINENSAYCLFGYYRSTVNGIQEFNLSVNNVLDLRLGKSTLYNLRNNGPTVLNISCGLDRNTKVDNITVNLSSYTYYPIMITYLSLFGNDTVVCNVSYDGNEHSILDDCTYDKENDGLYYYGLYSVMLQEILPYQTDENLYNINAVSNLYKIFSPDRAYGTKDLYSLWWDPSAISISNTNFQCTRLTITNVSITNKLLINGSGIHTNVSVFVDGVYYTSTYNKTLNVNLSTFLEIYLRDGLSESNRYFSPLVNTPVYSVLKDGILTIRGNYLDNISIKSGSIPLNPSSQNVSRVTLPFEGTTITGYKGLTDFKTVPVTRIDRAYLDGTTLYVVGSNLSNKELRSGTIILNTSNTKYGLKVPSFIFDSVTAYIEDDPTDTIPITQFYKAYYTGDYAVILGSNFSSYMPFSVGANDYKLVRRGPTLQSLESITLPDSAATSYVNMNGYKYKAGSIYGTFTPTILGQWNISFFISTVGTLWIDNVSLNISGTTEESQKISFNNLDYAYPFKINWVNENTSFYLKLQLKDPSGNITQGESHFSDLETYTRGTNSLDPNAIENWISEYTDNLILVKTNLSNISIEGIFSVPLVVPSASNVSGFQRSKLSIPTSNFDIDNIDFSGTTISYQNGSFVVPDGKDSQDIILYDIFGYPIQTRFDYIFPSVRLHNPSYSKIGKSMSIYGENISNTSTITFGSKNANFSYNVSYLLVTVPDGSSTSVTVLDECGITNTFDFEYQDIQFTFIDPTSGIYKDSFLLYGTQLDILSGIYFGNSNTSINISYSGIESRINGSVPDLSGNVSVLGIDPYGELTTFINFFYSTPTLSNVNPLNGPNNCLIELTGSYLNNAKVNISGVSTPWLGNKVKVPPGIGNVSISIVDNQGNETFFEKAFTYENPSVATISPLTGPTGTMVTITGNNLSRTAKVRFGTAEAQPTTVGETTTVKVPFNSGNVSIVVVDDCDNNVSFQNFLYENTEITELNPSMGPPLIYAMIHGFNLSNVSTITVFTDPISFTINSSISVSLMIPNYNRTSITFKVKDMLGNDLSIPYTYRIPSITKISPGTATTNQEIQIEGFNISLTKLVNFGNVSSVPTFLSDTLVKVKVPFSEGSVFLSLLDRYDFKTNTYRFTYINTSIKSMPQSGAKGIPLRMTGTYLTETNLSLANLSFGNVSIDFTRVGDTALNITVPPGEGTVSVYLTDFYNYTLTLPSFTYTNMSIRTIYPLTGTVNQYINVSGDYLTDISDVHFENVSTSWEPSTQGLTIKVPEGKGNVSIYIRNKYNTELTFPSYTYQNPSLFSIFPKEGPPNTTIKITGIYLSNSSTIQWNKEPDPIVFDVSDTEITLKVPVGTGNASIYVIDSYGNTRMIAPFIYINPVVTTFTPSFGATGTTFTLNGSNLSNTSFVRLNGEVVPFTYSNNRLLVTLIEGLQKVNISIMDNLSNVNTYTSAFTRTNPSVNMVTPPSGTKGTIVSLKGVNLSNSSTVLFDRKLVSIVNRTNESITVVAPELLGTVTIYVIDNLSNQTQGSFLYEIPYVSHFNPSKAPLGSRINISGVFLTNTSTLLFGDKVTTWYPITGGLSVIVPEVQGPVSIYVRDKYDTTLTFPYTFETINPSATQFIPLTAPQRSELTLKGYHLSNISTVWFGRTSVHFRKVNETMLTLKIPLGQTNTNVSIRMVDLYDNTATYSAEFKYLNPEITELNPSIYSQGRLVTLTGKNLSNLSKISFGNASRPYVFSTFQNVSDTEVIITLPPFVSEEVTLLLMDQYENNVSTGFTYQNPSVQFFFPFADRQRSTIKLNGSRFMRITQVYVGNLSATISDQNDDSLTIVLPDQSGNVSIRAMDGSYSYEYPTKFLYINPTITKVTPSTAPQNSSLLLEGISLTYIQNISFGNSSASFIYSVSGIVVRVPPGQGNVSIFLTDFYQTTTVYPFSYRNPSFYSFEPSSGPQNSRVNLSGEYLDDLSVLFVNASEENLVVLSGKNVSLRKTSGVFNVSVPVGTLNASIVLSDRHGNILTRGPFTYINPSILSSNLHAPPRVDIVINVSNFTDIRSVLFRNSASSIEVDFTPDVDRIVTRAPPLYGEGFIDILDRYNTVTTPFTYETPRLTYSTQYSGVKGETLLLSGEYLQDTVLVNFSNTSVSFEPVSGFPNIIKASIPELTGSVPISTLDIYGTLAVLPQSFIYTYANISWINPSYGAYRQELKIYGSYLNNISTVYLQKESIPFDKQYDEFNEYVEYIKILITDSSGTGYIELFDIYDNITTSELFTFAQPNLSSFTPLEGPKGCLMKLEGVNLLNTAYLFVQGIPIRSASIQRNSIEFTMPDTSGNASFFIIDEFENERMIDGFVYKNPNVSFIDPIEGPSNQIVTFVGINLNGTNTVFLDKYPLPLLNKNSSSVSVKIPYFSEVLNTKLMELKIADSFGNKQSFMFTYKTLRIDKITPSYGPIGSTVYMIGQNLNITKSILFNTNASFQILSNERLSFQMPSSSGTAPIVLIDTGGNQEATTAFSYKNPYLEKIEPTYGTKQTEILVTGANLFLSKSVMFGETYGDILSRDPFRVRVPYGSGNVSMTLTDIYNNSVYANFEYTNTSVFPFQAKGPQRSTLEIDGTYLKNITSILFGEVPCTEFRGSDLSYSLIVPLSNGTVSVFVKDSVRNIYEVGTFTYENPSFISLNPLYGPNNTPLTFVGDFLSNTSTVFVGDIRVDFEKNISQVRFNAPVLDGPALIRVIDSCYNTIQTNFDYRNASIVTMTPKDGVYYSVVKITGVNLSNTSQVFYGNLPGKIYEKTDTSLTVYTPNGSMNVSVWVQDTLTNRVFSGNFQHRTRNIRANASFGPKNTSVDLYGSNLLELATITFGGVPATKIQYNNSLIQVEAPDVSGTVLIEAKDIFQNVWPISLFEYRTPVLRNINPSAGPQQKEMVLTGDYLYNTQEVRFVGESNVLNVSVPFKVIGGDIHLSIPLKQPLWSNVSVQLYDEVWNKNETLFTYQNPTFLSFDPLLAPPNSLVTIRGEYLSDIVEVWFGDKISPLITTSENLVTTIVPYSNEFTLIQMRDRYQNKINAASVFRTQTQTILSISPSSGTYPMGLTIYGKDLNHTVAVYFGEEPADLLQILANTIYLRIPKGIGTVPIRIRDQFGNEITYPIPFILFNQPDPVPLVNNQKYSNQVSTKQLQASMIKGNKKVAYQNSRTKSLYNLISGLNYVVNRNLLLQYGYNAYMKYVVGLFESPQPAILKEELQLMLNIILKSLTKEEYNRVFNIIPPPVVIPDVIAPSNITIYVIQRTLGLRTYFIFKNLPPDYWFYPLFSYVFDLSDPSNRGSRLCFSVDPMVPYEGVAYVGTPGLPDAKLVLSVYKSIPVTEIYTYNNPDSGEVYNPYMWGYSVSSIHLHLSSAVREISLQPTYQLARQYVNLAVYENHGPKYSLNDAFYEVLYHGYRTFRYSFTYGTYYLYVPISYPVTLLNKGFKESISFSGDPDKTIRSFVKGTALYGENLDDEYSFSYGVIQLNIYRPFSDLSFYSLNYGFMGGEFFVHFVEPYAPPEPLQPILLNNTLTVSPTQFNGDPRPMGFTMGVYIIETNTPITFLNRGKEHLFYVRSWGTKSDPILSSDSTPYPYYTGKVEIVVCGYSEYMYLDMYTIERGTDNPYKMMYDSHYNAPEKSILPPYVLGVHNRIHTVENTYLTFNNQFEIKPEGENRHKFFVSIGVYHFLNIPKSNPITFLNQGVETLVVLEGLTPNSTETGIDPSGNEVIFYSGILRMTVYGDFGLLSVYSLNNGYMGGEYLLQYKEDAKNFASYPDGDSIPKGIVPRVGTPNVIKEVRITPFSVNLLDKSIIHTENVNIQYPQLYNLRLNMTDLLLKVQFNITGPRILVPVNYPDALNLNAYSFPSDQFPPDHYKSSIEYVLKLGVYILASNEFVTILNKGRSHLISMDGPVSESLTGSDKNTYKYFKGGLIVLYVKGNFGRVTLEMYRKTPSINLFRHESNRSI